MKRRRMLLGVLAALALLAGCASGPSAAVKVKDACVAALQKIPPAQPQLYAQVQEEKDWKNPQVIVRKEGVDIVPNPGWNQAKAVPIENLADALAALPATAWPYGRVVAVTPVAKTSPGEATATQNMQQVLAVLQQLGVAVKVWPGE